MPLWRRASRPGRRPRLPGAPVRARPRTPRAPRPRGRRAHTPGSSWPPRSPARR